MILDFAAFNKYLYEASLEAFDAIKNDSQNEHLYSFALSTRGLYGYIFPCANTEEGVLIAAKENIVKAEGFHGQLEMAIKCARWEPSSYWRFFKQHNDKFDKINKILRQANIQDELCKLSDAEFDLTTAKTEDILFNVLIEMRKNGCFGKDADKFYTNISYQDQSYEDLHRCALRVNSQKTCDNMWNDLSDVMNFVN